MTKKILLSSFGFRSPILREKFARALPADRKALRCLVLPYAGFHVENTFRREQQGLAEFGLDPEKVIFFRSKEDLTPTPDLIYVPGGDPYKLLQALRERELLQELRRLVEEGCTYIGVSAGADLATENIGYVTLLEENNLPLKDYGALGIIPFNVLCHYDHYTPAILQAVILAGNRETLPLRDDQLLLWDGSVPRYLGEEE